MITAEHAEKLGTLRSLSSSQIDKLQNAASDRIRSGMEEPTLEAYIAHAGPEPRVQKTPREWWQIFYGWSAFMQPIDYLIMPILILIIVVSITHNLMFTGALANRIYETSPDGFEGLWIGQSLFIITHQFALFAIAELGVVVFNSFHHFRYADKDTRQFSGVWQNLFAKYGNIWFILAMLCTAFVIYTNVVSMLHNTEGETFISIIVSGMIGITIPIITLTLSERLAEIIRVKILAERENQVRFYQQVANWRNELAQAEATFRGDYKLHLDITEDPSTHPRYTQLLTTLISDHYRSTAAGKLVEWDSSFERVIAAREIARLRGIASIETMIDFFIEGDVQQETPVQSFS